jgi:dolichyl-phosphate-mannose-protein mannosyltransferase
MAFWSSSDGTKKIAVTGNSALWVTSFFVFLFDIFWIALRLWRTRVLPIDKDEIILLAGYVMNYLPFFFIHRPMYLYHYFTALIFLILLLPKVTPRIIECLGNVTRDRLFAQVFVGVATVLIFVNFVLLLPATYGW